MASIAATNIVYPAFRNAVVGKTTNYNIDTSFYSGLATNLYSAFMDNFVTTPDEGDVFMSTYTSAETPDFAHALALSGLTQGTTLGGANTNAAAGVVNPDDAVFGTGNIVGDTGVSDPVESYVIYRLISAAEATSPLICHFGSATGLTGGLTPNGAAVTVVFNSGGAFRF